MAPTLTSRSYASIETRALVAYAHRTPECLSFLRKREAAYLQKAERGIAAGSACADERRVRVQTRAAAACRFEIDAIDYALGRLS